MGLPEFERIQKTGRWRPIETRLNWIVGVDYATTKEFDYLWQYLVEGRLSQLYKVENARKNPDQGHMRIVLHCGTNAKHETVRGIWEVKSASNERSMQGEEVHTCVLSEAAEHPSKVWNQYLSTRTTWGIWPTTPKQGARWIYDEIMAGEANPDLSIEHFTFPPEANPRYDFERLEIEKKKASSRTPSGRAEDDPFFAEQFLGRWVFYEGRVLPFFDQPSEARDWTHVLAEEPAWLESGYWAWSFDAGYNDPTCGLLWCVGMDGTMVVVDEVYDRHLTDWDLLERVQNVNAERRVEPACYVGDPKRPQIARVMRDVGLPVHNSRPNETARRAPGFRMLVNLLTEDPAIGRPMLYVHERCRNTIREMNWIRHKEGVREEYAEGSLVGDDHAISALRYGAMVLHKRRPKGEDHRDWWIQHRHRMARKDVMRRNAQKQVGSRLV